VNVETVETQTLLRAERRVCRRVPLRWPLSIERVRRGAHVSQVLNTVTENLSSRGFSCVVDEPVAAGERVACILRFPFHHDPPVSQSFRCQAQVVWVRAIEDGRFGIGCRIEDYAVVA
jgi:hypothetical protein